VQGNRRGKDHRLWPDRHRLDMVAYEKFHDGQMSDYIPTDADLQKGFDGIPRFPGNEL